LGFFSVAKGFKMDPGAPGLPNPNFPVLGSTRELRALLFNVERAFRSLLGARVGLTTDGTPDEASFNTGPASFCFKMPRWKELSFSSWIGKAVTARSDIGMEWTHAVESDY
jgi:hypothetical protein